MPYLNFNNSRIYYEVHGKGFPLLFLHGWNGCMDSFKFNLLDGLKNNNKIILVDLPGYGNSQKIDLSFEMLCKILDKLINTLKLKKINLMGFCMGAIIALDYTIRNQERVNKLILIETYIGFPLIIMPLLLSKLNTYIFRFFLFNRLGRYLTKRYLFLRNYKYRKNFFQMFQRSDTQISLDYIKLMWEYSKVDHYKRMQDVKTDVKIILGKYASDTLINTSKKINKNIKKSELIFLDNAGHFPIEENNKGLTKLIKRILTDS